MCSSGKAAILLTVILWTGAAAQEHSTRNNPFNTPADRAAGEKLFRTQCAACHGPDGRGGAGGPELLSGAFKRGDSDEALFQTVAKGIPGTNMPAFPGSGREAWQIVAHVRSLSTGRAAERAKGDPARGALLFEKHGCRQCHSIEGRGGSVGPDLTNAGAVLSLAQLRRSVLEPIAEVSPDYWMLRGRTKSGETISGVRLNEDTFSYQILDKGRLRSIMKSDLTEHEVIRTSMMPSYEGKLSPAELDDLTAFLAAQKGGAR
jgi:putative heme-binding domain-containing protein